MNVLIWFSVIGAFALTFWAGYHFRGIRDEHSSLFNAIFNIAESEE